jgi:hypothetical protein
LRSDAPRCGWQTTAAEVPAQNALSSSSQNATQRARQTEAQRRRPKSNGGLAAFTASVSSRALKIGSARVGRSAANYAVPDHLRRPDDLVSALLFDIAYSSIGNSCRRLASLSAFSALTCACCTSASARL